MGGYSNYNGANLLAQLETGMTALSWPALLVAGGVAGVGEFPSSR